MQNRPAVNELKIQVQIKIRMASNCHNDYSNKKALERLENPIQRRIYKF
jgi:hypothetical protein